MDDCRNYFLRKDMAKVGGLVITAAFLPFGGLCSSPWTWRRGQTLIRLGVYMDWLNLDPWFSPRICLRDLWHSRSPFSSTSLVHGAFLSPKFPASEIRKFESFMPEFESMLWPLRMISTFLNVANVLRNILGWKDAS